ncbi:ribosome-binding factor A [Gordonia spumicola]|uniref:Ribosome-binding factor A n=1 Tax=Gordonia spumicola TaxID=589161 RepID=A0A7I9VAZ6_9ACTN|nr:30S ribosome-binding factor RbfA [Gordonia spumicola]GEE02509.1 ribosome-binding factor A [Gordonia spumicola]
MVDHARAARLAKRITTIVASAIGTEIKDPRLAHVTITDCRVTGDLHDATVFYTVMGAAVDAEPDIAEAQAGLAAATGSLRSMVGAGTGVRFTPTLRFELDTVPDATRAMDELLARARAQDESVARVARDASPAGDSDPYRHDEDSSSGES